MLLIKSHFRRFLFYFVIPRKYLWPLRMVFLASKHIQNILECGPCPQSAFAELVHRTTVPAFPMLTENPSLSRHSCLQCTFMVVNLSLHLLKFCLLQGKAGACLAWLLLCVLKSGNFYSFPFKGFVCEISSNHCMDTVFPADIFLGFASSLYRFALSFLGLMTVCLPAKAAGCLWIWNCISCAFMRRLNTGIFTLLTQALSTNFMLMVTQVLLSSFQ